ncbi:MULTISPECIES: hypothetical protein [Photorhabdus]|uniref:Uncharacterized protein n=2 Tax=Photorhabdus TaxID=29487 RepID=A0A329VAI7_9GAMM|nr:MULTISPECIES: hypothetical protein [Photorhabdus]OCA55053.1 hypothetical protein Phpb_01966 [Photorhabdus namnaonensis]PQQ36581.1 hypothetical protein C6H68_18580 [Photorhabdus luminescens]RAW82973.1 hypothetical protein CKY01_21545 [Photorhabdus laumondii subsp. clarkei]
MINLGDRFPASFRAEFSAKQGLAIGDVLYLHCPFTTPPKLKYLLVCCCEPLLVLIINSKISEFIQLRQELLQCQVDLPQKYHKFLQWDSFINCIDAHAAFDINDIKERISTDYHNIVKGKVADYCMREVYKAVKRSPTMKRGQKRNILASLEQFVG